jgi:FkbM family methyltransferase
MISKYLTQIQNDGLQIDVVYDIGAHQGSWSSYLKSNVLPVSDFYLFEADSIHQSSLEELGFPYFIGVLSNPGRKFVEFYNTNSTDCSTGSSYYKENTVYYDNFSAVKFPCTTLESLIIEYGLPIPNLLKIDTQGSELDILRGVESYIDNIDLIYLECPIIKYNIHAPSIQDYIDYMKEKGFIPTEVMEIHRYEHVLLQIDIMFINCATKEWLYGPTEFSRPLV